MNNTSDSRFKNLELKIGLFILLAIGGCVAAVVFIGLQSDLFTPKIRLNFTADNGVGFSRGMPVKLSGFRIGRVESIDLNDQAKVDVRLQVDQKYQVWIRQDSVVRLAKEGFVGDSLIEVRVGNPQEPMLTDGSKIQFEASKGIEEHVTALTDQVKPVLAEVGQIITYVNAPDGDIKRTLHNIEGLTRDLRTTRAKADQLIDTSRTDLHQISGQVSGLLTRTDESLRTLNATLQRLDRTMTTVESKLPEVLERVDRTLAKVEKITADVEQVSGNLAPRVTPLVSRTGSAIGDTGDILRAVKQMWPIRSHLSTDAAPRLLEGDSHD